MSVIVKSVKYRCCDFCDNTSEGEENVLQTCMICGKDFCQKHGELFNPEYGFVDTEELLICQDCLKTIFKKKKPEKKRNGYK